MGQAPAREASASTLARELQTALAEIVSSGEPAAVLVIRHTALSRAKRASLLPLSELLRSSVRYSDEVLLDDPRGIGLVLCAADGLAAHAVEQRLTQLVRHLASIPTSAGSCPGAGMRLGIGCSVLQGRGWGHADIERTVATAWQSHAVIGINAAQMADDACAALSTTVRHTREAPVRLVQTLRFHGSDRRVRAVSSGSALDDREPSAGPAAGPLRVVGRAAAAQRSAPPREALFAGPPMLRLPAQVPSDCLSVIPLELALELRAVPVGRSRDGLTVASAEHLSPNALSRLRTATSMPVFPVLTSSREVERALGQLQPAEVEG